MENKILLNENKQIIINKNGKILTTKTNYNSSIVKITYDELVALRNESKLIPGQQYRITDYETTTSQEDTRSAGHRFDIIVVADDENTLNENARACVHEGETYFGGQTIDEIIYKGTFKEGITYSDINVAYTISIDQDGLYEGLKDGVDQIVEIGYSNGTPIFYKNGVDYIESGEEGTDYNDVFKYNGQVEYEGETYDCWKKFEDGKEVGIIVYTNIVVENTEVIETKKILPQIANLSAWELKYCLDNDTSRFPFASEYSIFTEEAQKWFYLIGFDEDYAMWKHPNYWSYRRGDTVFLSNPKLANLKIGDSVDSRIYDYFGEVIRESPLADTIIDIKRGKGVIYYMKDEYGNECHYDFKNIQFLRRAKDFDDEIYLEYNVGSENFPVLRLDYFQSLTSSQKNKLKYGLEYLEITGEEIIDTYFDGDYESYEAYLNKYYICLNDPDWNTELHYLIRISDYDFEWFYTFSRSISNEIVDNSMNFSVSNSYNLDTYSNKIFNYNYLLPNIVITNNSNNNTFNNCFDMSLGITYRNCFSSSRSDTSITYMLDTDCHATQCNIFNNISNGNLKANAMYNIFDNVTHILIETSEYNLFKNCDNLNIDNYCTSNYFNNISNTNVGAYCDNSKFLSGRCLTIGSNFSKSSIQGDYNTIGNNCDNIHIINSTSIINTTGNNCRYISIKGNYNNIGNNCGHLYLHPDIGYANNVTIGNNCDSINFDSPVSSCVVESNTDDIIFKCSIERCYIHGGLRYFVTFDNSNNYDVRNYIIYPNLNKTNTRKTIVLEGGRDYTTVVKPSTQVELIINEGEE